MFVVLSIVCLYVCMYVCLYVCMSVCLHLADNFRYKQFIQSGMRRKKDKKKNNIQVGSNPNLFIHKV